MNILITGKTSYIGNNIKIWLEKYGYNVKMISLREINIDKLNVENIDILIHCAAIVHKNEKKYSKEQYYNINYKMTLELAQKAKNSGVKQFVFFSTMSVYGINKGIINSKTYENPISLYGKSKLMAENEIKKLNDNNFKVTIIRPPMVYGKKCPGNYSKLSEIAKKIFIFPFVNNKRSMIYIENLCEFIKLIIENNSDGIFMPQNKEYINTSLMVKEIAKANNKNILMSKLLGKIVLMFKLDIINKVFGSLIYEKEISQYFNFEYDICNFSESIYKSELKNNK